MRGHDKLQSDTTRLLVASKVTQFLLLLEVHGLMTELTISPYYNSHRSTRARIARNWY